MARVSALRFSCRLLVLLYCLCMASGSPLAQDCLDYSAFPHVLSAVETDDGSNRIILDETLAYVGTGDIIEIFDVSEPDNPVELGSQFVFPATDFAVSGDHLYVASQVFGDAIFFRVYDVSDPANPQMTSNLYSLESAPAYAVAAAGGYAYLGRYITTEGLNEYTIDVVDVSDPATPHIVASMILGEMTRMMMVYGDLLYVTSELGGLQIVDVSNPLAPAIIGQHVCPARTVEVVGNLAFVAVGEFGMDIVDVLDPTNPTFISRTSTPGTCLNLSVFGDRVYTADSDQGVAVIDITIPSYPGVLYSADLGTISDVSSAGSHIFAVAGRSLQVLALPSLDSPVNVGSLGTLTDVIQMDITGNLICLGEDTGTIFNHDYKLRSIDVSNPARPRIIGTLDMVESINEVCLEGNVAYIASSTGGLITIDLSNPSKPQILGQVDPLGGEFAVSVAGPVAYIGGNIGDLYTIDVSDPLNPQVLGSVSVGSTELFAIDVSGDHAYIADVHTGVRAVDVSDPLNPQLVGTIALSGNTTEVCVADQNLFVGNTHHGLLVYDLATPAAPAILGSLPTGEEIKNLRVADGFAYLANAWTGLQIVDVGNPASPRPVGLYGSIEYGTCVAFNSSNIFLASETEFQVLTLPCPTVSPVLPAGGLSVQLAIHPNPFNPATTISYELAQPGHVSLEIFDLTGRRVQTLVSGSLPAGPHQAIWQGRDSGGRRMASGVYFCRLETAHQRQIERMTLLK
ncbi:MAG: FlgD immunoglobulin-like domain containing protein [Candidatus Krumholzibacteriota bacterium]